MTTSRRDFLKSGALLGAALALPPARAVAFARAEKVRLFAAPLRVPPVLKPYRRTGERDLFRTTMRKARVEILPGRTTTIWGFDGRFPGPTIKVRKGRPAVVRRINELGVPSAVHLHGGKVAPSSDGHPLDVIPPGGSRDYVYPNDQEAATLWYHDHTHHQTSRNNWMGLSGMYVIEDPAEDELNLPKGQHDVPLILQDRAFESSGSFRFNDHHDRVRGSILLVNGVPFPHMKVATRKYRFRILNASHSRGYRLALDNNEPLMQIATDQGLLTSPSPVTELALWPSERAEVVVDFSGQAVGTTIVLVHRRRDGETRPIMRFEVARDEADDSALPALLRPVERLLPSMTEREFQLSFDFDINRWVINGKVFDPRRIDVKPKLGDTETWVFRNLSSVIHPMHVHLVRFQVLDRSNGQLSPGDLGWKDTVRVDPSATVRVVMRFDGFTGRYPFHCHNLAHEDHSMMGQMRVVPQ